MPQKIELTVAALSNSESHPGSYALILEDVSNSHRIPIIIGGGEAQAIAIAMEKMQPMRPLTHDLFKSVVEALGGQLCEALIHQIKDGVFCATLSLRSGAGDLVSVEARTSDAVALAVRFNAPIFIYDHVMEEAGILTSSMVGRQKKGSLAEYTLLELEELLKKVVEKEDYESAVRIRAYIARRRGEL
jgi:hypothetical protein